MPALVAGIHDHRRAQVMAPSGIMDCRDKPGNDRGVSRLGESELYELRADAVENTV